jgi:hypothetical protein
LGGDGSGSTSLIATIVIVSLCSLVSIAQKEERKKEQQKKGQT